jgi:hypothetical protein
MGVTRRALVAVLFSFTALALAQNTTHLILKSGDYQVVQRYEVKGDRVRYYSAERREWEEIPVEMIDWEATHKYEAQQAKANEPTVEHIPTAEELQKQAEAAMTPEVAPNLRLPKEGGVFLLDAQSEPPRLLALTQNTGQVNDHVGKTILMRKVIKVAPSMQTVELPGGTSKVQAHTGRPVVYLNTDSDEQDENVQVARKKFRRRPSSDAYRFQFVKLQAKKDARILGKVTTTAAEESETEQTVLPTIGEIMTGDVWIRIEPKDALPPGEYAVAEKMTNGDINRYVWDFSVAGTPGAPAPEKKSQKKQEFPKN